MCSLNVRRVSFNLVGMKIIPTKNFPLRLRFEMVIEDNYGDDDEDEDEDEEGGPVVRSPVSVKGCPAKAEWNRFNFSGFAGILERR